MESIRWQTTILYDYIAARKDELCVLSGDQIEIERLDNKRALVERINNRWRDRTSVKSNWYPCANKQCHPGNTNRGFVPLVIIQAPNDIIDWHQATAVNGDIVKRKYAIHTNDGRTTVYRSNLLPYISSLIKLNIVNPVASRRTKPHFNAVGFEAATSSNQPQQSALLCLNDWHKRSTPTFNAYSPSQEETIVFTHGMRDQRTRVGENIELEFRTRQDVDAFYWRGPAFLNPTSDIRVVSTANRSTLIIECIELDAHGTYDIFAMKNKCKRRQQVFIHVVGPPSQPIDVALSGNILHWCRPEQTGNADKLWYTVEYKLSDTMWLVLEQQLDATRLHIPAFVPTGAELRVRAYTDGGNGPYSTVVIHQAVECQSESFNLNSLTGLPELQTHLHLQYELREILGIGRCSIVKRAVARNTQRSYAAKCFSIVDVDVRIPYSEFLLLQSISHENVLRACALYQPSPNDIVIVMQYVEGTNLTMHLCSALVRHCESTLTHLMRQVIKALDYIHRNNIVHGDIVPENILIERVTSRAILIDFDRAEAFGQKLVVLKRPGEAFDRVFAAPEQSIGYYSTPMSSALDIWGWGAICYIMITGQKPPPIKRLLRKIGLNGVEVIMACLSVSHLDRPTAASLLECAWLNEPARDTRWSCDGLRKFLADRHQQLENGDRVPDLYLDPTDFNNYVTIELDNDRYASAEI